MRLAANKRIRTIPWGVEPVMTSPDLDIRSSSHVLQDDITVIGVMLTVQFNVLDTHANTDGSINGIAAITRQSTMGLPGVLIHNAMSMVWTGILTIGGGNAKTEIAMFPDGCGVEIDEGESLTVEWRGSYIGTGSLNASVTGVIFYVER